MTAHRNAAVWLDHREARVFHVGLESFDEKSIQAPQHLIHRHPKGATEPKEHPDDQKRYFDAVAAALADTAQILVVGPSTAKLQFVNYAHKLKPALAEKIIGLETVAHPTEGQFLAHVKHYFHLPIPRIV